VFSKLDPDFTIDSYKVLKEMNKEEVKETLLKLKESGIESLAVSLMHSYKYSEHEKQVKELALEVGFRYIA